MSVEFEIDDLYGQMENERLKSIGHQTMDFLGKKNITTAQELDTVFCYVYELYKKQYGKFFN